MRLLNTTTFELRSFASPPRYAILSHTWETDEILFDDVQRGKESLLSSPKRGLAKVLASCAIAQRDSLGYIWIDTCCIDKSSSAELSEAINSMFVWYANSQVCYVYLADCDLSNGDIKWRWFTRGWTLQELVAPYDVRFFNADWNFIGTRFTLADEIFDKTGIDKLILRRHREACPQSTRSHYRAVKRYTMCTGCQTLNSSRRLLDALTVATRLAWVGNRQTTRPEDIAYCVMGIFDVNMPLLYGEGSEKAFTRLQQEIISRSDDQSILVWGAPSGAVRKEATIGPHRALTPYPSHYSYPCEPALELVNSYTISISSFHIELDAYLGRCVPDIPLNSSSVLRYGPLWLAFLNCNGELGSLSARAMVLSQLPEDLCFGRVNISGFGIFEAEPGGGAALGLARGGKCEPKVRVTFNPREFRKERIRVRLQNHLPFRPDIRKTTPPLQVQVLDTVNSFTLQESSPSIRAGNFVPPSPDPFTATRLFRPERPERQPSIFAALVFSTRQGKRAFVVICGLPAAPVINDLALKMNGECGVDIQAFLTHKWWQEADSPPFCLVLSWGAFTRVTEDDVRENETRLDSLSLVGRVRSLDGQLERFTLRDSSSLDLEGFQVKARIDKITSLQRQSMRVSIEIRENNVLRDWETTI